MSRCCGGEAVTIVSGLAFVLAVLAVSFGVVIVLLAILGGWGD
jgi:hypothetical protein